jgi:lipid-A-disaccharide synthase
MAEPHVPRRQVYFVVGEPSGDALAADLIHGFRSISRDVTPIGLAGAKMQALGMTSLFDISSISVMGLSGVVAGLPAIYGRIRQTVADIAARRPDVVVLIDSPEFAFRVARRVRRLLPGVPIVKYVCPSIWAWRPTRARTMTQYLDHILTILPFEPQLLEQLHGPPATYVGHPLAWSLRNLSAVESEAQQPGKLLLLLPGSRRSEVRRLLPDMAKTLEILRLRMPGLEAILPTMPHLYDEVRSSVATWSVQPEIVVSESSKELAFARADAALAASGTVLLELALRRVPMVSIYRLDWLMHQFRFLITGWTAALPNLISDRALVPERVNDMIRPGWLARELEELMSEGPARQRQREGFEQMANLMHQAEPPGILAARQIFALIK